MNVKAGRHFVDRLALVIRESRKSAFTPAMMVSAISPTDGAVVVPCVPVPPVAKLAIVTVIELLMVVVPTLCDEEQRQAVIAAALVVAVPVLMMAETSLALCARHVERVRPFAPESRPSCRADDPCF
jgi:hypothetical protein